LLANFFNARSVHALAATVASACHGSALAATVAALQLRHHLLNRTPRHKLNDHKGHEQHAEQGGNHQQQTSEDVRTHGARSALLMAAKVARLSMVAHQVEEAHVSGW
jgi:hypothetical protein